MHKIAKGLKKKKKGKKSKHKDEDLFTQEELEQYKKEHQQQHADEEGASAANNEEWKQFSLLTSGIDSVLNKTKEDLDRIKSTSFFQRIPPPSEVKKREEQEQQEREEEVAREEARELTEEEKAIKAAEAAIVQVSESESEEEEDDIFDTAYIDVLAAGEVKLAYIPESPTQEDLGDDPFDTTYAEKAILGPVSERKGKKLVPLGSAVEVLTGRVQAPTCVAIKRPSPRRGVVRDLLLEDTNLPIVNEGGEVSPPKPSLLDDDDAPPITTPIDLSKNLAPVTPTLPQSNSTSFFQLENKEYEEEDDEFAQLAVESLTKPIAAAEIQIPEVVAVIEVKEPEDWKPFADENPAEELQLESEKDVDPFDTTFAENILPGKAELKLIEKEILQEDEDDFDPRAFDSKTTSSIQIQIQSHQAEGEELKFNSFDSTLDRVSEDGLNLIKPIHRDLLGGSNTDLSNLTEQPLKPAEKEEEYIEYCDPFDTSLVGEVIAPGQAELKFLEKELLGDIKKIVTVVNVIEEDDDFDPRAFDDLNKSVRKVSFDLPLLPENKPDLLSLGEGGDKAGKPLTPYYTKNIIAEDPEDAIEDPFDTTFAESLAPGKAELRLIEKELNQVEIESNRSVSNIVKTIQEISEPKPEVPKQIDLLAIEETSEVSTKVLTPAFEQSSCGFGVEEISYSDPFDTSIANNILPGKTELKLIESELITTTHKDQQHNISKVEEDDDFDPRKEEQQSFSSSSSSVKSKNLLEEGIGEVNVRPLTPKLDLGQTEEDFDPFDTSIANNIAPGRAELKLLESELI